MKVVELYGRVRYAVQIEGLSRREAARQFGIDPRTVAKMLAFSVPPGYRRRRPPARPKLDRFTGIIDGILTEDEGRRRRREKGFEPLVPLLDGELSCRALHAEGRFPPQTRCASNCPAACAARRRSRAVGLA